VPSKMSGLIYVAVAALIACAHSRELKAKPGSKEWLDQCSPKWDEGCPTRLERAEAANDQTSLDQLQSRARYELQCPDATMTILERHHHGPATLVGVAGCGRPAALYERRLRYDHWSGGRTTRNTRWERKQ
jgi:hypothetical protein